MKQTFIICLENANGETLAFERWPYKKVETCVSKMIELYSTYSDLYVPKLKEAVRVTAYPTPDGYNREAPVWSMSKVEFLGLIAISKSNARNARISAFIAKMMMLEAQGFCSGGWDSVTDKTAIIDTRMPEHEIRIAGYMDRNLNIEWRDGYRRAENV